MSEGSKRDFVKWISGFRDSISDYRYYVDFEKVYHNVDSIKVELNILNSLIGSKNIESDFIALLRRYPETLKVIPILLAKRESEIYCQDVNGAHLYRFSNPERMLWGQGSIERYKYFMRETGLFDMLENHLTNNLVDYVTGVEAGLDSNARKNRGGHSMENIVEGHLRGAGLTEGADYFKEMRLSEIQRRWDINLSAISNKGKAEKRFDFVVKRPLMIYALETNFYSGGGSKLNETARSYKTLAIEANTIEGFTFVWITDGKGWISARHNLEETFDIMEHVYSIADLENGIIREILV